MAISKPVAFWDFNDTRVDSVGGLELVSGDGLEHYVDGKIGQGFGGDGIARHLALSPPPDGLTGAGGAFTVSVWVKFTTRQTGFRNLASVLETTTGYGWQIQLSNSPPVSATFDAVFRNSAGMITATSGKVAYTLAVWRHFAITFDGTTLSLYLDGTRYTADASSFSVPSLVDPVLWISRRLTGYTNCDTDSVGYWNACLTPEQVAELYNSGNGWEYAAKTIISLMRRYHRQIKD